MAKQKIAFQGERGANSEIACNKARPDMEAVPFPTFEDMIDAVKTAIVDEAMAPIENSTAGRVADVHRLLPGSGLKITGEYYFPVRFDLLAVKGVGLSDIHYVHSHLMAHAQCRKFVRKHGMEPVICADTAGAAREIAQGGTTDSAAIATELAAQIHGLNRLATNIQDRHDNVTRFVMLRRESEDFSYQQQECVTAFTFRIRNVPAALYKALGGFATNSVNMTKLESCHLDGQLSATQFYAEIGGHPEMQNVQMALEELSFFSEIVDFLGVFPAHPMRQSLLARR